MAEFGIVANVIETERVLRLGAKVWFVSTQSGGSRVVVYGKSRSGRDVEKHTSTAKLGNFRVAWIPPGIATTVYPMSGSRDEMEQKAAFWNERAQQERDAHPNRNEKHRIEPAPNSPDA